MFKNATTLKLSAPVSLEALTAGAERATFTSCGPTQPLSIGFVPPREANGAMVEAIGGHWIMRAMIETKSVPSSELNKRANAMAAQIERESGRKPGRKVMKELKEQALLELLPAAFPKQSPITIWVDPQRQRIVMDTASANKSDQVAVFLIKAVEGMALEVLRTTDHPVAIAGGWLFDGGPDVPDFYLGRDTELHATDESRAVVKYKAHDLGTDEIKEHIRQGYGVKQLALDWKSRASFALDTQLMVLRRIEFDDLVFEGCSDVDAFDADIAILTGELGPLLDDLVAAMGGEASKT